MAFIHTGQLRVGGGEEQKKKERRKEKKKRVDSEYIINGVPRDSLVLQFTLI